MTFPSRPMLPTDGSWPPGAAFAAILRAIDDLWQTEHRRLVADGQFRFLLIEQCSARGEASGEVQRAWIADSERLHHITDSEHADHICYLYRPRTSLYRFVWVRFWVADDGQRVCFGSSYGTRAGTGGDHLVSHDPLGPVLLPDPNGDRWIS